VKKSKAKFTEKSLLSDILATEHGRKVIEEFFGPGCLGCPAAKHEILAVSAHFHGTDVREILKKLNNTGKG